MEASKTKTKSSRGLKKLVNDFTETKLSNPYFHKRRPILRVFSSRIRFPCSLSLLTINPGKIFFSGEIPLGTRSGQRQRCTYNGNETSCPPITAASFFVGSGCHHPTWLFPNSPPKKSPKLAWRAAGSRSAWRRRLPPGHRNPPRVRRGAS